MSIGVRSIGVLSSVFLSLAFATIAGCGPASDDGNGGEHGELLRIDVEPANITIDFRGTPLSQEYTATGHYADGTALVLDDAVFSLDSAGARLGVIDGASFDVSGTAAGKGGVFATLGDKSGSTSVIVTMNVTTLGPGVPDGAADLFPDDPAAGAFSPTLVYPLDNALMPSSVKAPNVQWEGAVAGAGDLYRIRMQAEFATIDTILADASTQSFLPPAIDWSRIVATTGNGSATIRVDHYDPTNGPSGGAPVSVKLTDASVVGAIYYWHLDAGRMERIDADGRDTAIPNVPASSDGSQCIACHTVSRDGRYLAASLWGGSREGAVFDLTDERVRSTAAPAPTVAPVVEGASYTQLFATFNPDATRLLINQTNAFSLVDPMTGAPVTPMGVMLPQTGAAHPTWSPDGTAIAYASETSVDGAAPAWAVDYNRSNLSIIPVTAPDTFGAPTQIVANAMTTYRTLSWPTWAPDSQWIAYGNGTHSRGKNVMVEPGVLELVKRDGSLRRTLAQACGGAANCYLPNFSPFDSGGYYWMVFYSFKDYGNTIVGTKGKGRRQMWITAIDKSKLDSGEDPSSVPYWLPDQEVEAENMSAFWSLPAPIN